LVVIAFLLPGYWLGLQISVRLHSPDGQVPVAEALRPIPTLDHGQHTILLISVTDLEAAQPQLNSVWLISYFLPRANMTILPLYPSTLEDPMLIETELVNAFSFTANHNGLKLDPNFLEVLRQRNIWWSGYLVLDEVAFAQVIDAVNGITLSGIHISGSEAIKILNERGATASATTGNHPPLATQVILLQEICRGTSLVETQPDWAMFIRQVGRHILTDLEPSLVLSDWLTMLNQPGDLNCEFPTLDPQP
jgi:hypothetical protein